MTQGLASRRMTPSRLTGTRYVGQADPSPWVRPADWLPLTDPSPTDQRIVGLYRINSELNWFACMISGAFRVDFGDGAGWQNYTSGATASKILDWSDYAGTDTSEGFRQAIITIEPQPGNDLTSVQLAIKHPSSTVAYSTGWLDMRMALPLATNLKIVGDSPSCWHRNLEHFASVGTFTPAAYAFRECSRLASVSVGDTSNMTSFQGMFQNCYSLQSAPALNTANGTNFNGMFYGCYSLQSVPALNTAAGTNFTSMFQSCSSLQQVPLLNTAAGTNFTYMFCNCFSLQQVPLLNTAAGTNFTSMFYNCVSLQQVPLLNTAAGTNFTNMFQGCSSLQQSDITGTTYTISYASANLSAAALNNIYTNLGTASGAQTITVTGNWGTAGDDPSIATAKGWTVAGS